MKTADDFLPLGTPMLHVLLALPFVLTLFHAPPKKPINAPSTTGHGPRRRTWTRPSSSSRSAITASS